VNLAVLDNHKRQKRSAAHRSLKTDGKGQHFPTGPFIRAGGLIPNMAFRGTRILRYYANREKPEPELYDPLERTIQECFEIPPLLHLDLEAFAPHVKNPLLSDFEKGPSGLYVKPDDQLDALTFRWSTWASAITGAPLRQPEPPPAEIDFEVNMMEALVGWKSWFFDGGMLTSAQNCKWKPLEQMEAMCPGHTQLYGGAPLKCRHIPAEHHTCGFYAVNHPSQVMDDDEVVGQVYGWGRYVRGDNGWRAQFAYPKSFHLKAEQSDLVEPLRAYGVPIYLEQPMQVYFPEEDGYGHGQDNENGNLGAAQGSGSSEGDGHEASED